MTARPTLSSDDRLRIARGAERRFACLFGDQMDDGQEFFAGMSRAYAIQLAEFVRALEEAS